MSAIIVEYFIQNDDTDKNTPYPNIYILPMKYNSVSDVRVKDVIDGFPLTDCKYILRFETAL